ncbi:MAG: 50S ribosome-binding GTPase [Methylococcales bacterium]|nr:50S ribosome-binding GTPase [Methylococcales bacterium]
MKNPEDIAGIIHKASEEAIRERGRVNILIAGSTGVGKSTLINEIFQGKFANTGQGESVTKETREYTKENIPLSIFDTRGLEKADFKETLDKLEEFVKKRSKEPDPKRHIHVVWLCILEDGRRVEKAEIELHKILANYMPVIGVITKSRSDQGFRALAQDMLPETKNVVRVRALPDELDDGHSLPVMGLLELVELTMETLPEGFRRAFAAAQKISIQQKKNLAHKIVVSSATAASLAGANPIPISDAILLVPIQIGMLAGITATFGLEISTAFLSTLVAAAAGATGATFAGRAIVSNLLKIFPGVGSVAGGTISSATAATITTTLGELYIATLVSLFTDTNGEAPLSENVTREFKKRLGGK